MENETEKIPFHRSWIGEEEIREVTRTLESGWITTGPRTKAFEEAFAAYHGARHAVGVTSCTEALHLSLIACGVEPGDEVITTPMTWCSTANVVEWIGARPVFVDVHPTRRTLEPAAVEAAITGKTRAIIPVHFAGNACDLDAIDELAAPRGIAVVQDGAHAIETEFKGRKVGGLGTTCCFSFYPIKNITTAEGGMVTTNSDDLAEQIRILRLHGLSLDAYDRYSSGYRHFEVVRVGYKCNMTDVQAALGLHQMDRVEGWLTRRSEIVRAYNDGLDGVEGIEPIEYCDRDGSRSALHLYSVLVPRRDDFLQAMQTAGVGVGIHFTALHLHKFYREKYGYEPGSFPIAERIGASTLSLPLFPRMEDRQVDRVIDTVKRVYGKIT